LEHQDKGSKAFDETLEDALALLRKGELASASELGERLLKGDEKNPSLHQLAATIALAQGEGETAVKAAARSLALRPDHTPTLLLGGHAARSARRLPDALAYFQRALARSPERPEASFMTCIVLLELGSKEAQGMLAHCLEAFPNDSAGWRAIGDALDKRGQTEAALAAFSRANRAAPSVELSMRRGALLNALGRVAEAIEAFREAQALQADNFDAAMQLALAYRRLGDFETARQTVERAVTLDPGSAKAWFALGLVAEKQRDWPASIAAYRRALAAQPDLAEAAVNLGIVLQESGDLTAARQAYCNALNIRPDTFGRIAQALSAAPTGELWLDLQSLRRSLAA